MLQICFRECTLSLTQVFEWHKAPVIENLYHASSLSTSVRDDNIEYVKETVLENHHVCIREIAED